MSQSAAGPENTAAWLRAPRTDLQVGPAEMPTARPGEIIVRVRAAAINPLDWVIQGVGQVTYRWLRGPAVLGTDVAGEVVEVGPGVTRFAVGDRVAGLATGTDRGRDSAHEGAFQLFTALLDRLASPIPDAMSFADAAVVPLGVSTAACGLFQPQNLGLTMPGTQRQSHSKRILIWGGATSVGSNAVQLATAAGYRVVSTASPKNTDLVRALGADAVFDYRDPDVLASIREHNGGAAFDHALAVGAGSAAACLRLLGPGGRLAMASTPVSLDRLAGAPRLFPAMVPVFTRIGLSMAGLMARARLAKVRASFIWGSSLRDDDLGQAVWGEYLPSALASGTFRPVPAARVVGNGLASVQAAIDLHRHGVSAEKLVVTLD